jgi:glycosyltransferase involved in cell wall biosynthesis
MRLQILKKMEKTLRTTAGRRQKRDNENTLSVIIPIYNVEECLPKCIESVVNQTYKTIEIILVNDGSTDNCGQICDSYAKEDIRIKVVHKENGGLSSARNAGLNVANGRYIAFLDSDDWIDSEMYETLIALIEKHNADIAACGFKDIYPGETVFHSNTGEVTLYGRESAINALVAERNSVRFEVWNKVFKNEIIGDVRFKNKQIFEDVYFDRRVLMRTNCVVYIDRPMLNYLRVREGNTNSHFNEAKLGVFREFDDFIQELINFGLKDSSQRIEAFALHTAISLYLDACRLYVSASVKKQLRKEHDKYYRIAKNNKYVKKIKSKLFHNCPNLYVLLASRLRIVKTPRPGGEG